MTISRSRLKRGPDIVPPRYLGDCIARCITRITRRGVTSLIQGSPPAGLGVRRQVRQEVQKRRSVNLRTLNVQSLHDTISLSDDYFAIRTLCPLEPHLAPQCYDWTRLSRGDCSWHWSHKSTRAWHMYWNSVHAVTIESCSATNAPYTYGGQ